jgi:photosystem II stability/assembly factor-like uncharacterized protein
MKYIIGILGILLSLTSLRAQQSNQQDTTASQQQGQQGWVQIPAPTTSGLMYASSTGSDSVWAGAYLLRSIDRGQTWSHPPAPFSEAAVCFKNSRIGYAGSGGKVFRTSDGGTNWDSAITGLNDLHTLINIRDTLFGTYLTQVIRSIDGGKTWFVEQLNGFIEAVSFSDSKHGILVGDKGQYHIDSAQVAAVFTTSNGGESWDFKYSHLPYNLDGVAALNDSVVIAVSGRMIARSTNNGITWRDTAITPFGQGFWAITFQNTHDGIAVGFGGAIAITTDAGERWQLESSGTTHDLYGIAFIDDTTIVVAGVKGTVLRTTNRGLSWVTQPRKMEFINVQSFPNPSNSTTQLSFSLSSSQHVSLGVYNINGQLLGQLLTKTLLFAGDHSAVFDGSQLPSGTYSYQLTSEIYQANGQFQLVK